MLFPALVGEKSQRFVRPQTANALSVYLKFGLIHAVGGALQTSQAVGFSCKSQLGGMRVSSPRSMAQCPKPAQINLNGPSRSCARDRSTGSPCGQLSR